MAKPTAQVWTHSTVGPSATNGMNPEKTKDITPDKSMPKMMPVRASGACIFAKPDQRVASMDYVGQFFCDRTVKPGRLREFRSDKEAFEL